MKTFRNMIASIDHKNPRKILAAALDFYGEKVVLAMSFQLGGCVLLDMVHRLNRQVQVFSLDTGRIPEETYDCADRISRKYGIPIRWVFPKHEAVETLIRTKGLYSFKYRVENRKECCGIRKVEPLARALEPFDAWITGRRMDQSETRRELNVIEEDPVHPGKIKINPLVNWSVPDLWHYIRKHNVPYNRLYDEGYLSIGCECCTRPCKGGEDERAGRWWWERPEHKECGLHIVFKDGSGI
jgi:phosphoadenosine phosphosulfate reductase